MILAIKVADAIDALDAMRGIDTAYMKVPCLYDVPNLFSTDRNGIMYQWAWPVEEAQAEVDAGSAKWVEI